MGPGGFLRWHLRPRLVNELGVIRVAYPGKGACRRAVMRLHVFEGSPGFVRTGCLHAAHCRA